VESGKEDPSGLSWDAGTRKESSDNWRCLLKGNREGEVKKK
jgi:hypothetical protein